MELENEINDSNDNNDLFTEDLIERFLIYEEEDEASDYYQNKFNISIDPHTMNSNLVNQSTNTDKNQKYESNITNTPTESSHQNSNKMRKIPKTTKPRKTNRLSSMNENSFEMKQQMIMEQWRHEDMLSAEEDQDMIKNCTFRPKKYSNYKIKNIKSVKRKEEVIKKTVGPLDEEVEYIRPKVNVPKEIKESFQAKTQIPFLERNFTPTKKSRVNNANTENIRNKKKRRKIHEFDDFFQRMENANQTKNSNCSQTPNYCKSKKVVSTNHLYKTSTKGKEDLFDKFYHFNQESEKKVLKPSPHLYETKPKEHVIREEFDHRQYCFNEKSQKLTSDKPSLLMRQIVDFSEVLEKYRLNEQKKQHYLRKYMQDE
ncbi:hypothetical protein TRFO_27404 [Tritrichomonas foetus]|uniref:Uncharacterized protein n=1 Tax=Tritrichomonas foetus TaxID=1144522 RepID=A0A1J4K1X8_9EUKA|nr:hypothetical protein TRFO_27404 [Tritrichomonas foetus]|eukprot:OHT04962.1 hypothetical protein TRFO_27404 [Tritrichomonas foetus]